MLDWVREHKFATAGIVIFAILALLFARGKNGSLATSNSNAGASSQSGFIPTGFSGISLGAPQGGSIATYGSNGALGPGASNGALTGVTPSMPADGLVRTPTPKLTGSSLSVKGGGGGASSNAAVPFSSSVPGVYVLPSGQLTTNANLSAALASVTGEMQQVRTAIYGGAGAKQNGVRESAK